MNRIDVEAIPAPYPCGECDGRGIKIARGARMTVLELDYLSRMKERYVAVDRAAQTAVLKCRRCDGWGLIFPRRRVPAV